MARSLEDIIAIAKTVGKPQDSTVQEAARYLNKLVQAGLGQLNFEVEGESARLGMFLCQASHPYVTIQIERLDNVDED